MPSDSGTSRHSTACHLSRWQQYDSSAAPGLSLPSLPFPSLGEASNFPLTDRMWASINFNSDRRWSSIPSNPTTFSVQTAPTSWILLLLILLLLVNSWKHCIGFRRSTGSWKCQRVLQWWLSGKLSLSMWWSSYLTPSLVIAFIVTFIAWEVRRSSSRICSPSTKRPSSQQSCRRSHSTCSTAEWKLNLEEPSESRRSSIHGSTSLPTAKPELASAALEPPRCRSYHCCLAWTTWYSTPPIRTQFFRCRLSMSFNQFRISSIWCVLRSRWLSSELRSL